MDSDEHQHDRATRVRELEDMVQKLEQENKQLLHRVRAPGARPQPGPPGAAPEGDPEADVINLSDVEEGGREDEWLFVSPVLPPTPSQKVLTPVQWLSAGHTSSHEGGVPSLDDVRLALSFPMSEAETLSTPPRHPSTQHPPPRGYGAESSSPRARQPANRTARRYLDQVRMRRSPPGSQPEDQPLETREGGSGDEEVPWKGRTVVDPSASDDVPVVKWKARTVVDPSASDEVPVVKWKARTVVEPSASDEVPVVKWKARTVVEPSASDEVPVVKWKARTVVDPSASDEVPVVKWKERTVVDPHDVPNQKARDDSLTGEDVPVVRWKAKNVPSSSDNVPVVKWKAQVTPPSAAEEVPRVKWNPAKQPVDDVPVVKWRAQQATAPQRGQDEMPVVQRRMQAPTSPGGVVRRMRKPKNVPVKAVITQGRVQREYNESSEDALSEDSYGEGGRVPNGGDSDSQLSAEDHLSLSYEEPRPSRYTAHYQQSPDRSPGRGLPRPVMAVSPRGSPSLLRSRSPSPSVPYLVRSRSPSPSVRYGDRSTSPLLRHSPQSARRQILPPKVVRPHRSPSPVSRASQQSQAKVPSPSDSPLTPRKRQTPNSSLAAASPSAVRHSSPGRPPSGLPPSGTRPRQSGLKTPQSSPASAGSPASRLQPRGSGLTPPARAQGKPKRVLPSPPSSGLRAPGRTKGSPHKSLPPRTKPPPAPAPDDDSSWLEGCF